MPDFSVQTLMDRAKTKADMRTGNFVEPQEWIDFFNNSHARFRRMITARGYIVNTSLIAIPASGAVQYIMTEPLAILACFESMPDGYQREVVLGDTIYGGRRKGTTPGPANEVVFSNSPVVSPGLMVVEFFPVPASGNYNVVVVPSPTVATVLTQTFNIPNGWEDWIVCDMAEQALAKEETINPALEKQKAVVEGFVEEAVMDRQFAAAKVRNVDGRQRGWSRSTGMDEVYIGGRWMRL